MDDPRLSPYRSLKGNHSLKQQGLFIVEGIKLVERLLASDIELTSLLVTERLADRYLDQCEADIDFLVADNAFLSQIVGFDFHRGLLACGKRPPACCPHLEGHDPAEALQPLASAKVIVACPLIHDPENMGLIVRTVAGLGADGLLVSDSGADAFARRCLRVSMGAAFSLPIVQVSDMHASLRAMKNQHAFQLIATTLSDHAVPVHTFQPAARFALLVGSEPDGLPADIVELADACVSMPMYRGIDSHNVAVATGMLLHHLMDTDR